MKVRHGLVELAGDVGDGLRGVAFAEYGFEHLADLAGGDAAEKSLQDEVVHGLLAALVTRKNLGTEPLAGARDPHASQPTELRDQIAEIEAVAVVQAGERGVLGIAELQMAGLLNEQKLLDQAFQFRSPSRLAPVQRILCTRQSPA